MPRTKHNTSVNAIPITVGIFASNEEVNIERAVKSVLASQTHYAKLVKIIVVSSGSLDKTNRLVRSLAVKDKRIGLIEEAERKGKSAAINRFLQTVTTPVVATMSADLTLAQGALEEITLPFLNDEVGMVGGHPVPRQTHRSQIGPEIKLLWELHHQVSLRAPKCGEFVAFRNVIKRIPRHSAVDEATIEVLLRLLGYAVVYAPRCVVYNRGPANLGEFLTQRRRVQTGHQWVKKTYNYQVSTLRLENIADAVLTLLWTEPANIWPLTRLILMEGLAMILGYIDFYILGKNPYRWKMINR